MSPYMDQGSSQVTILLGRSWLQLLSTRSLQKSIARSTRSCRTSQASHLSCLCFPCSKTCRVFISCLRLSTRIKDAGIATPRIYDFYTEGARNGLLGVDFGGRHTHTHIKRATFDHSWPVVATLAASTQSFIAFWHCLSPILETLGHVSVAALSRAFVIEVCRGWSFCAVDVFEVFRFDRLLAVLHQQPFRSSSGS